MLFIFGRNFHWVQNSQQQLFTMNALKITFHYLRASVVSIPKSACHSDGCFLESSLAFSSLWMLLLFFALFFCFQMLLYNEPRFLCLLVILLLGVCKNDWICDNIYIFWLYKILRFNPSTYCFWCIICLQCSKHSNSLFPQCCLYSLLLLNFNSPYSTLYFSVVGFLCGSFPYGIAFNLILGIDIVQSVTSVPSKGWSASDWPWPSRCNHVVSQPKKENLTTSYHKILEFNFLAPGQKWFLKFLPKVSSSQLSLPDLGDASK